MRAAASNKQNKSILLRILIVVFCVYMLISLGNLYRELCQEREALAAVNIEKSETQAGVDEINNLLENGTEEEILEKAARDRLGYVYPNEQVFVDISGN